MLERLARYCFVHRWRVLIFWIVAFVGFNIVSSGIGPDYRADMSLPDSESKEAQDLLEAASPASGGFTGQIVFEADDVNDPALAAQMEAFFDEVATFDDELEVSSPYGPQGDGKISDDGTIAFAELQVSDREYQEMLDLGTEITDTGEELDIEGVTIEYGGEMFGEFELPASELLGVLAAIIILLIAFGSVIAMGLPIGTAVFGLGIGVSLTVLMSNVQSMPDFAPNLTAMIGLGVGIDYALFIVTRYRENLHAGEHPETATALALDTAGRAVLFAGATVIISLLGLYLMGLPFVRGIATGAALGVVMMMIAAVTLLPALIGFAGRQIEVTAYRGLISVLAVTIGLMLAVLFGAPVFALVGLVVMAGVIIGSKTFAKDLARPIPRRAEKPREQQFWYRWSRVVQHHPWASFVAGLGVLLLLAVPMLSLRLGFGDTGNLNEDQTPRRAYDMLAEGFGPGFNGPIFVVVPGEDASDPDVLASLAATLRETEGVEFVSEPRPVGDNDDLAMIALYADSAPQDVETTELVHRLRDDVIPATGVAGLVGGFNAASVDFADYLGDRLPYLIGAVLILSFLLLMVVFRSVLVPLKAVVMNLLSIGAAYGIVVAVFQWGWAKGLIDVDRSGPIDAWVPMMLFAIVFGLSMDYEVFLLSRMKEEYDRTGDNNTAVADGLAATARVITAAALIMFCVFSAFVLGDDRSLKLFGLGLAAAVLVDATVVRMLLVPATMELLGNRNWWLPRWLEWLPRVHIEGKTPAPVEAPEAEREPELVGSGGD